MDLIHVIRFRGIKEFHLPIGEGGTVVVGENGTGKSSIVDAIEYAVNGVGDGHVELGFRGLENTLSTVDGRRTLPSGLDENEWSSKGKFVLRRREIADFVRATENRRTMMMRSLLGMDSELCTCLDLERTAESMEATVEWLRGTDGQASTLNRAEKDAEMARTAADEASTRILTFITTRFGIISTKIERFYRHLHPGDLSAMSVIGAMLQGNECSKLSEGHLDSLALCIFLSNVASLDHGPRLMVLDDVMTTVDASHRSRVSDLLVSEFPDHQLIVTTHDRIWFEQLRGAQRAHGVDPAFVDVVLVQWDETTGPVASFPMDHSKRARHFLAEGDIRAAGNTTRQYLECTLSNICLNLEAKLTYQGGSRIPRYTLEEMLIAARTRTQDLIGGERFDKDYAQVYAHLEAQRSIGNMLSHDNPDSMAISSTEVLEFLDAVEEVAKAYRCPGCDRFLRYYRQLSIIRCPDPRCPLKGEIQTHR